jgi:hypothetical protein
MLNKISTVYGVHAGLWETRNNSTNLLQHSRLILLANIQLRARLEHAHARKASRVRADDARLARQAPAPARLNVDGESKHPMYSAEDELEAIAARALRAGSGSGKVDVESEAGRKVGCARSDDGVREPYSGVGVYERGVARLEFLEAPLGTRIAGEGDGGQARRSCSTDGAREESGETDIETDVWSGKNESGRAAEVGLGEIGEGIGHAVRREGVDVPEVV